MPVERVCVTRVLPSSADRLWEVVSDFRGLWHPAILSCALERGPGGRLIRAFRGADGSTYREQRTYFSSSDRRFQYLMLSGIEGVQLYRGDVRVEPVSATEARLSWAAEITAPQAVLDRVIAGTRSIFDAGFDVLERDLPPGPAALGEARSVLRTSRAAASALRIAADEAGAALRAETEPKSAVLRTADKDRGAVLRTATLASAPRLTYLSNISDGIQGRVPVIFLHGIGGHADNWRPQLEAIGRRHPVAASNMRGYGGSDLGEVAEFTRDALCDDVRRLSEDLGATRFVLVGLSMGAWIATAFALQNPKRLAGLVLAGGCSGMSEASDATRAQFLATREAPLADGKTPADLAPSIVDLIAGPDATPEIRHALQASMSAIPTESYRAALRCFCASQQRFDFAKITCPVLLMTGAHDPLAPPEEIRTVSERMHAAQQGQANGPDIRFEVLAGAGHLCNLEAAPAFTGALAAFLDQVVPQGA